MLLTFLLALLIFVIPKSIYAQSIIETDDPIGSSQTSTVSAVFDNRIDYELPYPGMLPDHPLYLLKELRDRLVKFLINEDLVMAKFDLKYSEKNVYASKMLLEKGKKEIALKTLSNANQALEEAVGLVNKMRQKNPKSLDIRSFLFQFKTSTLKEVEVLNDIKGLVDKGYIEKYENELKRVKSSTEKIERILKEKK